MNKIIKTLTVLFIIPLLYGCAGYPASGTAAIVLADEGVIATKESNAEPTKTGKACSTNILGLVTTGDASIDAAAYDGNIKTITSVDRDIKGWNIYISLGQSCTIVRGY